MGCTVMLRWDTGDVVPDLDSYMCFLSVLGQAIDVMSQFNSNEDICLPGSKTVRSFGKQKELQRQ